MENLPTPRAAAIIQARMGSSRLPGKVLQPLAGRPVLWHVIHRLLKCRNVQTIAIATTTHPGDDPIAAFAAEVGVLLVRGPEENVLGRYAQAAAALCPAIIVRVTGDAPLIDPETIDQLIEALIASGADYSTVDPTVPCIHEGFCVFTAGALGKLVREAAADPAAREHVSAYFKLHPGFVRTATIPVHPDHQLAARMSVDTPADFRFLEELYARLNSTAGDLDVRQVVRLLRAHPELQEINRHVYQKPPEERGIRVLCRCDGDGEVGLGHVVRTLALADELRERQGMGIVFAMARGPEGFALAERAGYPVARLAADAEEATLARVIDGRRPDVLLLDVRSALAPAAVERWRQRGILVVTLDDPSERRLAADLVFSPPVKGALEANWDGFTGERHIGWDWVVLRRQFAVRPPARPAAALPHVLVTMGGSDPAGFTLKAIRALDSLDMPLRVTVVAGSAFAHRDLLQSLLRRSRRRFDLLFDVADMAGLMADADLAVASFGVTAYELAALGVPAVYLCLGADHAASSEAFVKEGLAVSLGVGAAVSDAALAAAVAKLLGDSAQRAGMSERARATVDGRGAARIAGMIAATTKRRGSRAHG